MDESEREPSPLRAAEPFDITEGSGVLEVEGENVELREGHAVFVPAGAEHRFVGYEHLSLLVIFETSRA